MRRSVWFLVLLVVGAAVGCAGMERTSPAGASPVLDRIAARGEVRVGVSGDMPPMNLVTRDDQVIGLDIDLATMIAQALGVELRLERIDFSGLLPALETGKIDLVISNMTMTPERNLKAAFVGPYFISGKGLLTKQSQIAEARKLGDIDRPDLTLAALTGSTSEVVVRKGAPRAQVRTAATQDAAIQMVLDGQADALIADFPVCAVAVLRHPDAGLKALPAPITYEPIGIAAPKGDPHLVNWLGNLLHSLEQSGYLKGLRDKWFTKTDWLSQVK
jgi:polar amino acid transport system substrate-binding protein